MGRLASPSPTLGSGKCLLRWHGLPMPADSIDCLRARIGTPGNINGHVKREFVCHGQARPAQQTRQKVCRFMECRFCLYDESKGGLP